MGHSYCSGPIVLSEDLKNYHSAPTPRKNLQLRSPGCPHNANRFEVREYCDNGIQNDIREFLQQEQPPPEPAPVPSRTNSKRKKQILDMLFKSRYRSSRPSIRHGSPLPSITKDQRTIEGRMYSQIGLDDKQMYEVGNSSTYKINYCKPPTSPTTVDPSNGTMNEKPIVSSEKLDDPAPQLDIVNDYGVGISKEWPPELLESGETELPQEAETETGNKFPGPSNCLPKPVTEPRVRDYASSRLTRFPSSQAATIERQPSPILNIPHPALFWTHPHVSTAHTNGTPNINGGRASALVSSGSIPIGSQFRLQASPPKTPRRSRQKSSLETAVSPMLGGHSKTPSMRSGNESTVEDVQSDAESAIVLEAQSAEFIRAHGAAGFYNGSVKPPKPGPAPTRALPSLPEGHDGSITVQRGSIDSAKGRISLESGPGSSPKRIPPKSPARRYGYLPSSIVANSVPSTSPRKSLDSGTKHEPCQTSSTEQPKSSSPLLPANDLLPEAVSHPTLEQRQYRRTSSTKALKMRDLEHIKARRAATSPAVLPDMKPMEQREGPGETLYLPNTRYSGKPSSAGHCPQGSHFSDVSAEISQPNEKAEPANDFSPIIVVAEQEPTLASERTLHDSQQVNCGSNPSLPSQPPSQPPNSPAPPPFTLPLHFPVPPLPTLERPTEPSLEPLFDPLTHRISMSHADLEARLEARISALEKKNVLLEKAFLAVLNTSATFNIQTPPGDRSSGFSGASSMPGWDGRVDSMIRGMQGGVRMSTASGP